MDAFAFEVLDEMSDGEIQDELSILVEELSLARNEGDRAKEKNIRSLVRKFDREQRKRIIAKKDSGVSNVIPSRRGTSACLSMSQLMCSHVERVMQAVAKI